MELLTNNELEHALTVCNAGTCFSGNCPLKDADGCMTMLLMNALISGNREFILSGISIYENHYGSNAFLNDVKSLFTEA